MQNELEPFLDYAEFAAPVESDKAHSTLDIPAQLVWECAARLEPPEKIAERFGITGKAWERLSQWEPFISAVQKQSAEFDKNGVTFRLKAGLMAEQVMDQMFKQAVGMDVSLLQRLNVFNALVDVAGLKPDKKQLTDQNDTAPKFSITINIPQNQSSTPLIINE
jgi:hypothetical protein